VCVCVFIYFFKFMGIHGVVAWILIYTTRFHWSSVEKMTTGASTVKNLTEGPICHMVKT
jgi:hypothetical protein